MSVIGQLKKSSLKGFGEIYKKEHNSGKNYRKIVIIELDLDTLRYTYIPHLASFTGYHTETTKIANLKYN
jgi:hypothetical protein